MAINREIFVKIIFGESQQNTRLDELQIKFNEAIKNLAESLNPANNQTHSYQGRDNLYLTLIQIKKLVDQEFIKTPADVILLLSRLHPKEIATIFSKFTDDILKACPHIEDIFTIMLGLNPEQITVFVNQTSDHINSLLNQGSTQNGHR